ncbi:MAG: iron-containing alcohol dehydrogenase, partial [Clostridia bacterium]|nr:iron-containing alcohol dehydrogenase [Clostridia bacterium]
MEINVEHKNSQGDFPKFFGKIKGLKIAILCDANTKKYAEALNEKLLKAGADTHYIFFDDKDLIPDEFVCEETEKGSKNADYLLAVGSGSLNDVAKAVSTKLGINCGVLATAASMDGYCSKGSALMRGGFKVTDPVHTPSDVLIDADIIKTAPRLMTASGFGDIVGKFTCLTDWKLANILKGEEINEKAYQMMEKAREECMSAYDGLVSNDPKAVEKLTDALIVAGLAMAECGNSRPASGSEHHISHFLEMDFVRRGERV